MNKRILNTGLLLFIFICWTHSLIGQNLKPYTIGAINTDDISSAKMCIEENLKAQNFQILGSYIPAKDPNRQVIVFSSQELKQAVRQIGGLSGFALAWRVGITKEGAANTISYTTPEYWGNAYFRSDFEKVKSLYSTYGQKLALALAACGENGGKKFGSEEGLSIDKLQDYKYMFGMPKFHSTKLLKGFTTYEEAISTIDANLAKGVINLKSIYSIELKDQKLKLYGVGLSGEDGEEIFVPKIDLGDPKHTAFLPYEFLVVGNEVHMLHGRFRIALSFPDLSMGQFMKIVSTPPSIKRMIEKVTQ